MWIPIIIPFGTRLKSKVCDNKKRICINCKNSGVQLLKNDEWFHLFFVPLVKINKGQEYLHCPTCGATWPYVPEEHYANFNNPEEDVQFESANKKDKKRWGKKHKYDGPPKPQPQPQQQQYPQQQQQQYPNYDQQQYAPQQMSQEHYQQQPMYFNSEEQQKFFNENQPIGPPDRNYNAPKNDFTLEKNTQNK
ncbi:hypothetical protein DICPUDRAFT_76106 [Dictyostelium purpureum]|uniref:Zinc-ribbon 15 domain-containing protein n=1 Tax=Dictyostelium purpureum TaxID=5786 RepID=F0ZCL9_DICPU|nr:uncharacterized protein DICPUDRAFT_76106 [Dictyostelium purpureum]EGC38293.1 hypothetical protein DICPUDRAFT_76106 [Dictyostelium purpureum]|eukprot:XP_003285154.1 hypothetical protein DICPUDRAFT_76106 [Dictyostelium purpureum]